ncbi:MAG: RHS repeat-associated core domain-containing protein [Francisellaceae bacterium]
MQKRIKKSAFISFLSSLILSVSSHAGTVEYLYTDGQSNNVLIMQSKELKHLYRYSAYGIQSDAYYPFNRQSEAMGNAPRLLTIDDNPFGYGGQHRDSSTALWSLGNGYRQYDALTGGFMQADSLSAFSGKNTENAFNYAGGNPIGYNDPTGHFKVPKGVNYFLGSVGIVSNIYALKLILLSGSEDTSLGILIKGIGGSLSFWALDMAVTSIPMEVQSESKNSKEARKLNRISFGFGLSSSIYGMGASGLSMYNRL